MNFEFESNSSKVSPVKCVFKKKISPVCLVSLLMFPNDITVNIIMVTTVYNKCECIPDFISIFKKKFFFINYYSNIASVLFF